MLLSKQTPLTHSGCVAATPVDRKPPRELPDLLYIGGEKGTKGKSSTRKISLPSSITWTLPAR